MLKLWLQNKSYSKTYDKLGKDGNNENKLIYYFFFFFNPGRLIADKHDKTEGFFNPRIKLTYFRSRWSNSQYVQGCRKIKNPGCGLASKNIISTDWEK